jgi:hypothetical protein
MLWALHMMLFSENPAQRRYRPTARAYEKFRAQFYDAVRGVPVSRTPEHAAKIAEANRKRLKGAKFSKETKQKMSAAHAGERNAMYGKKHSDEAKAKIRAAKIGKPAPHRPKLSCLVCRKETTKAGLTAFHGACHRPSAPESP